MQATQKIVNLGLMLGGGAVFLFLMNLVRFIWGLARLPRMHEWMIEPNVLISLAIAAAVGVTIRRHAGANRFLNEVVVELSKVTWPDRKETFLSTGVSCILVVICSIILFLFDSLWGTILSGIFSV